MAGRAQSLSVNTLIIVALGILVLIVSIAVYNKYVDRSDETISSCENQGGACMPREQCGGIPNSLGECPTAGHICCFADTNK